MTISNSHASPVVAVPDALHECRLGWAPIADELRQAIAKGRSEKPILVVECYPGVDEQTILKELESRLSPALAIHAAEALLPAAKVNALAAPYLSRDKSMSGRLSNLSLVNFFSAEPLWRFRRIIDEWKTGLILIAGCGASLIAWGHLLVYADLTRREAQLRFHRNESANLGVQNHAAPPEERCRRACLVDWRVADRWKRPLINRWDFALDTHNPLEPKLADGEDVRRGLAEAARRPFRFVPSLEPALPGGQGLKKISDSERAEVDSGWCFDCVPEENALALGIGETCLELPALDLVFHQPLAFLGHDVHVSFGYEFPIRFDNGDAIGGSSEQNLADHFEPVSAGDGWREEKNDRHEARFIEMRRHWFRTQVQHHTRDSVNVLSLVEGGEIVVESPANAFAPFIANYADTFVVPAAVGEYTIRPHGPATGQECATIKAFVRT